MSAVNVIGTIGVLAQVDSLASKLGGLAAQALAALLGVAVAWVAVVVVWNLLTAMAKSPDMGKLVAIVGVGLMAVFLVGAAPDLLSAAYTYGQGFLS